VRGGCGIRTVDVGCARAFFDESDEVDTGSSKKMRPNQSALERRAIYRDHSAAANLIQDQAGRRSKTPQIFNKALS
ncbi:MAG TPA: hypothetical protein P5114_05145, partial [Hyphomicrobiaceae bacterium]|nr:hypothetical protein [Hyphomicrobiaceae bacterium]